jgi:hypothetical protein
MSPMAKKVPVKRYFLLCYYVILALWISSSWCFAVLVRYPLDYFTRNADLILIGRVISKAKDPAYSYNLAQVRIEKIFWGEGAHRMIPVISYDYLDQWVEDEPVFEIEEQVLLFLKEKREKDLTR